MILKHNWENYPQIESILIKIYQKSVIKLKENNYDIKYANEFIEDIEDYIMCTLSFNYNLNKVIKALENIEYISFQKESQDKELKKIIPIYSKKMPVISCQSKILINKDLEATENLTERDRRKLYLFHGLTHNILNFKNDETYEFSKLYSEIFIDETEKKETETIVYNGWLLLEYAISEEIAERFIYFLIKKPRPKYNYSTNERNIIIDENHIVSNLEFVRMFQPILINFGKTIGNIGTIFEHSKEIIIYKMLKKAFNEDITNQIIDDYFIRNDQIALYQILYLMGLLLNAECSKYNIKVLPNLTTTVDENNYFFEEIKNLTSKLTTLSETEKKEPNLRIAEINDITKHKILKLVKDKEIY